MAVDLLFWQPPGAAMATTEQYLDPGKPRQPGHRAVYVLTGADCGPAFGRGPTRRYDAQARYPLHCRDDRRRNPGRSGPFCPSVAIWMVATRSRRPMALGWCLGSRRPLGAPRSKLGLSFAPPCVAKRRLGKGSGRSLGMARRLGSGWLLGAPGSELGLPLVTAFFGTIPFQGSAEPAVNIAARRRVCRR